MKAPHVCILQTSFAKREDTVAFLKEKVPGVRVEFITDSTLLNDIRANGGPTQAVIDRMTLYAKAAAETGAIVTAENHNVINGLGSAVAEVVVQNCPVPMEIVGIQDRFGESGDPELLYRDHGMDVDSIVAKAKALVARKCK